jgi:hypothetical protein
MAKFRFRVAQLLCSTIGFVILAAAASPAHAEGGRVKDALITELSLLSRRPPGAGGVGQILTLAWVHFNVNVGGVASFLHRSRVVQRVHVRSHHRSRQGVSGAPPTRNVGREKGRCLWRQRMLPRS